MERPDLEKWLRQGLGRAASFIQAADPARYRDALLHACTHNLCYDRQCEETRGYYFSNLVRMTNDPGYFRNSVLAALSSEGGKFEPDDVLQMFAVAQHWAADGSAAARQTLYAVFARDAFERAEIWCGHYLVKLDGLDGLLFVLDFLGRVEAGEKRWMFELLVSELEEREGNEAAAQALAAAALDRPELADLLEMARIEGDRRTQGRGGPSAPRKPYSVVGQEILSQDKQIPALMIWARTATEEELEFAAEDLRHERDEARLYQRLLIFRDRRFPGAYERLIELAKTGNWRLSHAATTSLSHIEAPELRSLGLDLLSTDDRADLGLELLTDRGEPGDYKLIEQALRRNLSEAVYHGLGLEVLGFVEANLSDEAVTCLELLYENGPCSTCRESCVRRLIALDRFPDWMRDECLHDAESGTRELAESTRLNPATG